MVNVLILLLFLISGAATGWLGVDLLPERLLLQVSNMEGLRTVLGGFGAFFGLLAGFFFQQLRRRLMQQVRSMPTASSPLLGVAMTRPGMSRRAATALSL